jgi:hypothetical protein
MREREREPFTAPTRKVGGREFFLFADAMVPVDEVRCLRRHGASVRVELAGDVCPHRDFTPLDGADAPGPAARTAAGK